MNEEKYFCYLMSGCSLHSPHFQRVKSALESRGYTQTRNPFSADIIIAYHCAMSTDAFKDSGQAMEYLRQVKALNPNCRLIVGGCAAEVINFQALYPFVDHVFTKQAMSDEILAVLKLDAPEKTEPFVERGMMAVAIATGCRRRCSFCKQGYLDMTLHSRPLEEILDEVAAGVARHGARYLHLLAENSTEYGLDLYGEPRLLSLLKALTQLRSLKGITVNGLCFDEMTPELLDFLATEPLIDMVQLEIQSLDPQVRRAMNLKKSANNVIAMLKRLDHKAITTNIMVGHPGETSYGFKKQLALIKKLDLYYAEVNRFDPTPGTPSYDLPQPPEAHVEKRLGELGAAVMQLKNKRIREFQAAGSVDAFVLDEVSDEVHLRIVGEPILVEAPRPKKLRAKIVPYSPAKVRITGINLTKSLVQMYQYLIVDGEILEI